MSKGTEREPLTQEKAEELLFKGAKASFGGIFAKITEGEIEASCSKTALIVTGASISTVVHEYWIEFGWVESDAMSPVIGEIVNQALAAVARETASGLRKALESEVTNLLQPEVRQQLLEVIETLDNLAVTALFGRSG